MELTKKEKARIAAFRRKLAEECTEYVQSRVNFSTTIRLPMTLHWNERLAAHQRAEEVYWTHMQPLAQAELDRRHQF